MKFVAFLAVFIILKANAMDEEFLKSTRAKVRKIAEDCVSQENAQMSDLDTIMDLKIPDSHEGKCVLFCTHKKFNVQNDDGSINREGAMETLEIVRDVDADFHKKAIDAFDHCMQTPTEPDPCLYSASLSICFLKKAKEEGIHELIME
ncbi:hypothetical protein Zmor_015351 [Zophobas morio]|uniref:Uncharacterized protein n=1 Tax=Zophobas morio TaxID=2755281 RepID=A0AA38IE27_9CUCU|nr:hypothetical protein Zmor_015351 [Zophobas morio]